MLLCLPTGTSPAAHELELQAQHNGERLDCRDSKRLWRAGLLAAIWCELAAGLLAHVSWIAFKRHTAGRRLLHLSEGARQGKARESARSPMRSHSCSTGPAANGFGASQCKLPDTAHFRRIRGARVMQVIATLPKQIRLLTLAVAANVALGRRNNDN